MTVCITIFGCVCVICAAICYVCYIKNVYVNDCDTGHVTKLEDIFYRIHPLYERYVEAYARKQELTKEDSYKMFEAIYDIDNMLSDYPFNKE